MRKALTLAAIATRNSVHDMKLSINAGIQTVIVLFLVLVLHPACSEQEDRGKLAKSIREHADWDPARFVVDRLRNDRIVMVADYGHGVSLYYRLVVSSLYCWVSEFEHSSSQNVSAPLPRRLFLILEANPSVVHSLNRYFESSNPLDIVHPENFVGYQFTSSTIEFYDDLRRFKIHLDSLNGPRQVNKRLHFEVFGPEKTIDLATWTQEWAEKYFVEERDEFSSMQVRRLLDSIPDAKALVYYGAAHLDRREVAKLAENTGRGYFMAHYLTNHNLGRGGVYTCAQISTRSGSPVHPAIRDIARSFAIDNSIVTSAVNEPDSPVIPMDGSVYLDEIPQTPRHISTILSDNLVDLVVRNLEAYNDSTKPYYRAILFSNLFYLAKVAPREWRPEKLTSVMSLDSEIVSWKRWRKSTRLDVVRDISTLAYFRRLIDIIGYTDAEQSSHCQQLLTQLIGFTVWVPPGASPQEWATAAWQDVQANRRRIVIDNLVQLLWVGSPTEIRKAKEVLREETNKEFGTAKEWSSWWQAQPTH